MIETHLDQLRTTLEQATGLPENTKAELLELVTAIRNETGPQGANVGAPGATETSTAGISGLMASVETLEVSHPEIAALINQVAITLSRMGI